LLENARQKQFDTVAAGHSATSADSPEPKFNDI
jgi:hypothetical protein